MNLAVKKKYDFETLEKDLKKIKMKYPFCEIFSIGQSTAKRAVFCLKIGNGREKVFYNAAHHGAEWITSPLLMKFAEEYLEKYVSGKKIGDISAGFLMENVTLFVVPMVNPDGVDIAVNGARKYTADYPRLFRQNNNSSDFSRWQANFKGVDLNHNYDALWDMSDESEFLKPGPTKYKGKAPFSEYETKAMKTFTEEQKFKLTMSFHSQGREVYYSFNDKEPIYSYFLARALTIGTVYKPAVPTGSASYGGYKDWFIDKFQRVGFTVEVGEGENPLPMSMLKKIYRETLPILTGGMKIACLL